MDPAKGDEIEEAQRARNARRPIGPAEEVALKKLRSLGAGEDEGYITPDDLPKFGTSVADFDKALERHVVKRGWFAEAPSKVTTALGRPRRARHRRSASSRSSWAGPSRSPGSC